MNKRSTPGRASADQRTSPSAGKKSNPKQSSRNFSSNSVRPSREGAPTGDSQSRNPYKRENNSRPYKSERKKNISKPAWKSRGESTDRFSEKPKSAKPAQFHDEEYGRKPVSRFQRPSANDDPERPKRSYSKFGRTAPSDRKSDDQRPGENRPSDKFSNRRKKEDPAPFDKKTSHSRSFDRHKKASSPRSRSAGSDSTELRLNKYIASTGLCSRREADEMIAQGLITVNGKIITELGVRIGQQDEIRYNGTLLREERKVYILLNKPKDVTTTTDDPHAKITVLDLVRNACRERIFPVGRLDRSTTGVLLLTNDGELTKKLTHPKYNKKKIYHVFLDKKLKNEDFRRIMEGTVLEDGPIQPDAMHFVEDEDRSQVGLEIHSGRNRVVRRIFEFYGYRVKKLDRVYFAGLTKKGVERGHWRFLTEKEIKMLKMGAYE